MEGTLLSVDCEIEIRFCFIKRPCLLGNQRDMLKSKLCKLQVYRGPVREPGGSFAGEFERH